MKIITLWKKEVLNYATSLRAYVLVALLTAFSALWFFVVNLWQVRDSSMRGVTVFLSFLLLAITPILTMRTLAEENSRGTLELLLTSPVREWDIVLGKFLGALTLYMTLFAITLIFPLILFQVSEPEKGPLFTQYLGLVLSSAAFISVGIFASAITESQVIAAITGYVLLLAFWIIGLFAQILPT
ncbi:MAG TPA: ABC transporter permease subunit, partial [bacterium]|nr:ABC transporter permease subunit [bacterium]